MSSADRRWLCFDVGEVLIDESRIWSVWAEVLGVPAFTLMATMGAMIAQGRDHAEAFARLGHPRWADHADRVQAAYGGFTRSDLYPDALPALAALSDMGYGVAVIANQPAVRHAQLEALGVRPEVMAMSEALGVEKPAAGFFVRVLQLLDAPAASVAYVGDRVDNDIAPASAAGLRTVRLRRGPWGWLQADDVHRAALQVDSLDELVRRSDEVWAD